MFAFGHESLCNTGLGIPATAGIQLDSSGKVATSVAGTQVLVDGLSPTQINAVAPYELAAKKGQTVFVQAVYNNVAGNVYPVLVADTAPGIFYTAGGQGAILNQDFSYNARATPPPRALTFPFIAPARVKPTRSSRTATYPPKPWTNWPAPWPP